MRVEYIGPIQNAAETETATILTVADVSEQARVDSASENDLIAGYIAAAQSMISQYLGKSLFTQTWKLYLNGGFPYKYRGSGLLRQPAPIVLKRPPVQSIEKIYYIDLNGDEQELTSDKYQVQLQGSRPKILPAYGLYWPDARCVLNAVRVEYTAGYGADNTALPPNVVQAARMITASFYEGREAFSPDMQLQDLQGFPVLRMLLDPNRVVEIDAL